MHHLRCAILTATTFAALLVPVGAGVPPRQSEEVRGLWVLRSTLTSPARITELIRTAVDGGYNTLMVQVRGRGDAYYQSALEPRAAELAGQPATFDPLALTLDRAHAAGLRVHAWFNVNLVASAVAPPKARTHIAVREPGWLMVPAPLARTLARLEPSTPAYVAQLARWTRGESDQVEGMFLSPIPEASQQYTLSIVRDLLERYKLDGLHLDYIRYPTADFDYSKGALQAFRAHHGGKASPAEQARLDALAKRDPLAWAAAFPQAWEDFRRDRLNRLVERIRDLTRETRPDAVLSAAVVPVADDARRRKLQDWSLWAQTGLIDVICPMAYATTTQDFARQMADVKAGAHGRPVWAGIGAWRLPVSRTIEHLRTARRHQTEGVLMYSYDSLMTAVSPRGRYFTQLRSALVEVDDRQ